MSDDCSSLGECLKGQCDFSKHTNNNHHHQQQQQAEVSTVVGVRKIGVVELNSLDPDEPKAMAACAKVDDVDCKYFTKKGKKYKVSCGCWVG